jgi:hypothetical protein
MLVDHEIAVSFHYHAGQVTAYEVIPVVEVYDHPAAGAKHLVSLRENPSIVLVAEVSERGEPRNDEVELCLPRQMPHVAFDVVDGDPQLRRLRPGEPEKLA